jgi:hypothetical protein
LLVEPYRVAAHHDQTRSVATFGNVELHAEDCIRTEPSGFFAQRFERLAAQVLRVAEELTGGQSYEHSEASERRT